MGFRKQAMLTFFGNVASPGGSEDTIVTAPIIAYSGKSEAGSSATVSHNLTDVQEGDLIIVAASVWNYAVDGVLTIADTETSTYTPINDLLVVNGGSLLACRAWYAVATADIPTLTITITGGTYSSMSVLNIRNSNPASLFDGDVEVIDNAVYSADDTNVTFDPTTRIFEKSLALGIYFWLQSSYQFDYDLDWPKIVGNNDGNGSINQVLMVGKQYTATGTHAPNLITTSTSTVNLAGVSFCVRGREILVSDYIPAALVSPVISGTPAVGSALSISTGTWSNDASVFTYVWKLDGVAISGATTNTYTPVTEDEGSVVSCTVTVSNGVNTVFVTITTGTVGSSSAPIVFEFIEANGTTLLDIDPRWFIVNGATNSVETQSGVLRAKAAYPWDSSQYMFNDSQGANQSSKCRTAIVGASAIAELYIHNNGTTSSAATHYYKAVIERTSVILNISGSFIDRFYFAEDLSAVEADFEIYNIGSSIFIELNGAVVLTHVDTGTLLTDGYPGLTMYTGNGSVANVGMQSWTDGSKSLPGDSEPPTYLEPGVDGIFYWNVADGLTPTDINPSLRNVATYYVDNGALKNTNTSSAYFMWFDNAQGNDQYTTAIREAGAFTSGEFNLILNATPYVGYVIKFLPDGTITLYNYETSIGNYPGDISWTAANVKVSAKKIGADISVYVDDVLKVSWTDTGTPITGGNSGFSFTSPSDTHRLLQWDNNPF